MVQEIKPILVIDHHPKFPLPTQSYTALCLYIQTSLSIHLQTKRSHERQYVAYEHQGLGEIKDRLF